MSPRREVNLQVEQKRPANGKSLPKLKNSRICNRMLLRSPNASNLNSSKIFQVALQLVETVWLQWVKSGTRHGDRQVLTILVRPRNTPETTHHQLHRRLKEELVSKRELCLWVRQVKLQEQSGPVLGQLLQDLRLRPANNNQVILEEEVPQISQLKPFRKSKYPLTLSKFYFLLNIYLSYLHFLLTN